MTRCADSSCKSSLLNPPARWDRFALALSLTLVTKRVPSDDSAQRWAGRSRTSHVQQCLSYIFESFVVFQGKPRGSSRPRKVPQHLKSRPTVDRYRKWFYPTMSGPPVSLSSWDYSLLRQACIRDKNSTPPLPQYAMKETSLLLRQKPPLQAGHLT